MGKDSAGKVFVYNSDPQANDKYTKTYLEGKEAKEFLANKIGVSLENEVMKNSNTAEYDVKVASPVIK